AALRTANPQVPVELVTTSASGLDPHLSPQAVEWQIPRVAKARQLSVDQVEALVSAHTQTPLVSFIGQPVVNIVELNMALDALKDN
ncbi:MAG TPA: potassium-transporting ATPase subunit C, partial [Enterobacteriaceae bacterium]|nr:potassium-transporting ATPase subunit C [Enterobacteriaceae bacterium]